MPTIKDDNNVVLFSDPFKVYLFKDKKRGRGRPPSKTKKTNDND